MSIVKPMTFAEVIAILADFLGFVFDMLFDSILAYMVFSVFPK
jgi:hypothetical protein